MNKARTSKPPAKLPHHLLLGERRRLIVEFVEQHGRATVAELSTTFGTSAVTIRGDLAALADAGALVRSHGGALPVLPVSSDVPLGVKATRRHEQKLRIGQAASKMIHDGETIILDSGSTTVEIARAIRRMKFNSLTVITNALNIAMELSGLPNIRVMMLGGLLRQPSYSLVGPDAEQALAKLSADRLFLGVDGLDLQVGVSTPDPLEAALNVLMIRVSRQTIAVLDASKLARRSLSVIAPISSLHKVICDHGANPDIVNSLRNVGLEVVLV